MKRLNIEKLIAVILFGGVLSTPVVVFANSDSTSENINSSTSTPESSLDESLMPIPTNTAALDTPQIPNTESSSSLEAYPVLIDNINSTSELNISKSSTSSTSNQISNIDVAEIGSSTQNQRVVEVPTFVRSKIEPVPAPLASSFKEQPTLRNAPKMPIYTQVTPRPRFILTNILASSSIISKDVIVATSSIASSSIIVNKIYTGNESTSTVPIANNISSTTNITDENTIQNNSSSTPPVQESHTPLPQLDVSAVVNRSDDSPTTYILSAED